MFRTLKQSEDPARRGSGRGHGEHGGSTHHLSTKCFTVVTENGEHGGSTHHPTKKCFCTEGTENTEAQLINLPTKCFARRHGRRLNSPPYQQNVSSHGGHRRTRRLNSPNSSTHQQINLSTLSTYQHINPSHFVVPINLLTNGASINNAAPAIKA
jgi:hypothetical protein